MCGRQRGKKKYKGVRSRLNPTEVEPILEIRTIFRLLFDKKSNKKTYKNLKANLVDAYLEGIILMDMNLTNAQMREANLEKMRLYCSNLQGAFFTGANLSGAYFIATNLKKAILIEAEMKSIVVKESNLKGTIFGGADMQNVRFENNKNLTVEQLENMFTFYRAEFIGDMEEKIKRILEIQDTELFKKPKWTADD